MTIALIWSDHTFGYASVQICVFAPMHITISHIELTYISNYFAIITRLINRYHHRINDTFGVLLNSKQLILRFPTITNHQIASNLVPEIFEMMSERKCSQLIGILTLCGILKHDVWVRSTELNFGN